MQRDEAEGPENRDGRFPAEGSLSIGEAVTKDAPTSSSGTGTAEPGISTVSTEQPGRYLPRGRSGAGVEELGRGGMGRVVAVYDTHMGREVALKELLAGPFLPPNGSPAGTSVHAVRFVREARLTGRLAHPNIVPVYELGRRQDGTLYYTMKLVQGTTMADQLARCRGLKERLRLLPHFLGLCQAVAYAHSKGVIHRDIKPDNVMVGEFGETVVLDWGLAKVRNMQDLPGDERASASPGGGIGNEQTAHGTRLGTPAYMSPEQVRGDVARVDERSDVWALGVVLYEILVGTRPFAAKRMADLVKAISLGSYRPPREVDERVPPELASICAKALQPDPEKRYPDARPMAADVESFLTGGRVAAYEYSSWELIVRFVRKNRIISALAAVLVITLVAASVVIFRAWREADASFLRAEAAREAEEKERVKAQTSERRARTNLAWGYLEKAERLLDEQQYLIARVFAAASLLTNPGMASSCPEGDDIVALAKSAAYAAAVNNLVSHRAPLIGHEGLIRSAAFSPDGSRVATGSFDHTIRIWDTATGTPLAVLKGHHGTVRSLDFLPDAALLASTSADGTVRLWDTGDGRVVAQAAPDVSVPVCLDVSPDGLLLAVTGVGRKATLYRLPTLEETGIWLEHDDILMAVAFSPDGKLLATASNDKTVGIWDPKTGERVHTLSSFSEVVRSVAFSPGGGYLAAGSLASIHLFSTADFSLVAELKWRGNLVWGLSFSPDEKLLAAAGMAGDGLKLWRIPEGKLLFAHAGLGMGMQLFLLSPDGKTALVSMGGRMPHLWDVAASPPALSLTGHRSVVYLCAFSPDGRQLATGGVDGLVGLYDVKSGIRERAFEEHEGLVYALGFSPDGKLLASTGSDGLVIVRDLEAGGLAFSRLDHPRGAMGVAFSPKGEYLASAGMDGRGVFRATTDWSVAGRFDTEGSETRTIQFSPDGSLLAVPCSDSRVRVFSVPDGTLRSTLEGHRGVVAAVAFHPSGRLLASCGEDGTVRIWDVATGRQTTELRGHSGRVWWVTFSPDGKLLASSGFATPVRINDVETGHLWLQIRNSGASGGGSFSPDGRVLAVPDANLVKLYPLPPSDAWLDPAALLDETQREAGVRLNGFQLVLDEGAAAGH